MHFIIAVTRGRVYVPSIHSEVNDEKSSQVKSSRHLKTNAIKSNKVWTATYNEISTPHRTNVSLFSIRLS